MKGKGIQIPGGESDAVLGAESMKTAKNFRPIGESLCPKGLLRSTFVSDPARIGRSGKASVPKGCYVQPLCQETVS
jgi:hypothetical protein